MFNLKGGPPPSPHTRASRTKAETRTADLQQAVQFVLQTRQDPASYLQLQRPLRERTGFLIAETVGASTARVARSVDVFCAGTEGDQTAQRAEGGRSLLVLQNNTFPPFI